MPLAPVHRPRLSGVSRGFTIIEIMVVLVLIGIIAGMVVPQLVGSSDTVRLDAAAHRVGDMMDFCYHAAASSGKVHALLFDTAQRRMDVVCESATPPPGADSEAGAEAADPLAATQAAADGAAAQPETSAPADASAGAASGASADATGGTGEASGTTGASAAAGTALAVPDPDAPINLVPVSIPGYMDHTLPEGIALSASETYEAELSQGENEGQFKLLFFPDGTTEFARIELSIAAGQRREVFLNGLNGNVTVTDPDREETETTLSSMIMDEDNPEANATEDDPTSQEESPSEAPVNEAPPPQPTPAPYE